MKSENKEQGGAGSWQGGCGKWNNEFGLQ